MTATTGDPILADLLSKHPRVSNYELLPNGDGITLTRSGQVREILSGRPETELYGLLELMDNNPIVCADRLSIPSLAASLFLISLGPLLLSGLVVEPPSFITNLISDHKEMERAVRSVGWDEEVDILTEPHEVPEAALATGIAVVEGIASAEELREFYRDRFSKSPVIREAIESVWTPSYVDGKPLAQYRVTVNPDSPNSLVSVHAMADRSGVFQAAQLVSAMNVMLGFEDELGLSLQIL